MANTTKPPAPRAPLSILAIAAAVMALVPCCPFTGLAGALLGLVALRRVRLSGGALRGRRLALAAVLGGSASAMIWSIAWQRWASAVETGQREQAQSIVHDLLAGDAAAVPWTLSPSRRAPEREVVEAFRAEFARRYGALTRLDIVAGTPGGHVLAPRFEIAGVLRAERGSPLASALWEVATDVALLKPQLRLMEITVEDPDQGDLTLAAPPR